MLVTPMAPLLSHDLPRVHLGKGDGQLVALFEILSKFSISEYVFEKFANFKNLENNLFHSSMPSNTYMHH